MFLRQWSSIFCRHKSVLRFGRRPLILVSFVASAVFGVASALSTSYVMFAVLRTLCGVSLTGMSITTLALSNILLVLHCVFVSAHSKGYPYQMNTLNDRFVIDVRHSAWLWMFLKFTVIFQHGSPIRRWRAFHWTCIPTKPCFIYGFTQALSGSTRSTERSLALSSAWPGAWATCSWPCWPTVCGTGGTSYWWSRRHAWRPSSLGGEIRPLPSARDAKSETVIGIMSGMPCMAILTVTFDLQVDPGVSQMASGQWQSRRSQEIFGAVCQDERKAFSQTRFRGQD